MKKFRTCLVALLSVAAMGAAMAQSYSGYNVDSQESRRVVPMEEAVLLDILPVKIQKEASPQSRTAGQLIGGVVASAATIERGNWALSAAAGALGALAGDALARKASSDEIEAHQLIVKTASGRVFAILQEGAYVDLMVNDRVYVMYGQTTRVVKSNATGPLQGGTDGGANTSAGYYQTASNSSLFQPTNFQPRKLFRD